MIENQAQALKLAYDASLGRGQFVMNHTSEVLQAMDILYEGILPGNSFQHRFYLLKELMNRAGIETSYDGKIIPHNPEKFN